MKGNVCSLINLNYSFCFVESYAQLVPMQQLPAAKSKDKQRKKKNQTSFVSSLVVTIAGSKWNLLPVGLGRTRQTSLCSSISYTCRTSGSRYQNKCSSSSMAKNEASSGCSNFRVGMSSVNHTRTLPKSAKSWRVSGEDTDEANIYFRKVESTTQEHISTS